MYTKYTKVDFNRNQLIFIVQENFIMNYKLILATGSILAEEFTFIPRYIVPIQQKPGH